MDFCCPAPPCALCPLYHLLMPGLAILGLGTAAGVLFQKSNRGAARDASRPHSMVSLDQRLWAAGLETSADHGRSLWAGVRQGRANVPLRAKILSKMKAGKKDEQTKRNIKDLHSLWWCLPITPVFREAEAGRAQMGAQTAI